jgi:poly(beta-D-mannuronate) lyase
MRHCRTAPLSCIVNLVFKMKNPLHRSLLERILFVTALALFMAGCSPTSPTTVGVVPDGSVNPDTGSETGTPEPNPKPSPQDTGIPIAASSVSASTYDDRCDCAPSNSVDGNYGTRWSGNGDGAYINFDLGSRYQVDYISVAWHEGDRRVATFDVQVADSASGPWTTVLASKASSGTSTALEQYDFADVNARHVRIVGHGNSGGDAWSSIVEVRVYGNPSAQVATPRFDPPGGSFIGARDISITTVSNGAQIRYTTDGTQPSAVSGAVYSAPIPLTTTTTLKAIALQSGIADSDIATATYTITAPTGGSGLDPSAPPSTNFNLSQWKLTIPSGSDISVSSLNKGYTLTKAFFTDPATGGMVFRCPNIGGTTSGSSYSRTELREMLTESAGTTSLGNNWVLGTSSSSAKADAAGVDGTMKVTLSVDHVSTTGDSAKVGRVVVGQIHGPDTEIIRLYFHKRPGDAKGAIYFGHDTPSNSNTYYPIIGDPDNLDPAGGIALGERWDYEILVTGQLLTVKVTPDGGSTVTKTLPIESGYNNQYLYYKAGVYNQNNTGDGADYVQATIYSLTHTHP